MIDPERLLGLTIPDVEQHFTARDTILYALAVGYGADPLDERALAYCHERDLKAAPTLPLILAHPGAWMRDLDTGIDYSKVVHGEQSLTLHGAIPVEGTVVGQTKVVEVIDKGADKGAVVLFDRLLYDSATGDLIATMRQSNFCRGEGGFDRDRAPAKPRTEPPSGPPDQIMIVPTRPEAALLYRMSADLNALHVDPHVARAAGFPRPILHGLATFGMTAQGILKTICQYADDIGALSARFSAPLFPGESLRIEIWKTNQDIRFTASSVERGTHVLTDGSARTGPPYMTTGQNI